MNLQDDARDARDPKVLEEEVMLLRLALVKIAAPLVANTYARKSFLKCTNCKCRGHSIENCPFKGGGKEGKPFPPKLCSYCKELGYYKNECPQLIR